MKNGFLTTHILDTANGCPAANVRIALFRVDGDSRTKIVETITNEDGRSDKPILGKDKFGPGVYELVFEIGDYFRKRGAEDEILFIDIVPVRFGISNINEHYHVPLLVSPYSFSTYRGS